MKGLKNILVIVVVISFMLSASAVLSHVQPNIPREKIPTDIPSDVRTQIEGLYSSNAVERANSAIELGRMGARAAPAVPFLIGILGDARC